MAAHAGEKAQETGDFYCTHCSEKVHMKQGDEIPPCPNGHKTFETGRNEPATEADRRGRLTEPLRSAEEAGLDREQIVVDPGIDLGRSWAQFLHLLARLDEGASLGPGQAENRITTADRRAGRPGGRHTTVTTSSMPIPRWLPMEQ